MQDDVLIRFNQYEANYTSNLRTQEKIDGGHENALAEKGVGLSTYISQHIKGNCFDKRYCEED